MSEEIGGPYIQIAAFCQTALIEGQGAVSIIRILDRIAVQEPPPESQGTQVQLTLVVILKSGFFKGRSAITIRPKAPGEQILPPIQFPCLFEGDERGVQIILPMLMVLKDEGLYWFEISIDGSVMTQVPLRILHQPQIPQQMGTAPG